MAAEAAFLALDLGAESGRAVLGCFDGERISLDEVHRFPNVPVKLVDGMHWDALRIFTEVKEGLKKAVAGAGRVDSLGVDSWGVDFGLLDRDGSLVSNPYYYRDPRTEGTEERALERMSREEIYGTTGIQFMPINTLNQLIALEDSPLMEAAQTLLMMPDLICYWLTGEKAGEFTISSTSQLLDASTGDWAWGLLERLGIPARLFPEIRPPGVELGRLLPGVAGEAGEGTVVTSVASHDTASAVVAVPAENNGDFAYISSGTWSLVGLELPGPVITEEGLRANFTNEGGFGGTTRFLKNVMGLWLLQECRRTWARDGREYSYEELTHLAEAAPAAGVLVDPDHPVFLPPGDMPSRIRSFCEATGQEGPEEPGAVTRCVLESLALKYRWVLEKAEEITGLEVGVVHVVGGGVRNELLCRLTADATRRPVRAGPVEATALGNLMVQAYTRGYLASLEEIREAVRSSVKVRAYEPRGGEDRWQEAFEKLRGVMETVPRLDREGAST
jgi:rhamnulokinase